MSTDKKIKHLEAEDEDYLDDADFGAGQPSESELRKRSNDRHYRKPIPAVTSGIKEIKKP